MECRYNSKIDISEETLTCSLSLSLALALVLSFLKKEFLREFKLHEFISTKIPTAGRWGDFWKDRE